VNVVIMWTLSLCEDARRPTHRSRVRVDGLARAGRVVVETGRARDDSHRTRLIADDVVFGSLATREYVAAILLVHARGVVVVTRSARGVETLVLYIFT